MHKEQSPYISLLPYFLTLPLPLLLKIFLYPSDSQCLRHRCTQIYLPITLIALFNVCFTFPAQYKTKTRWLLRLLRADHILRNG